MATSMHTPIAEHKRIEIIDVLRGFAVFGILVANMAHFSGQAQSPQAWIRPLDRTIYALIRFFIEAKFYSLFSFLFGWGMAVQLIRASEKGKSFLTYYTRRLLILFIIGLLHSTFLWIGDILTLYAILGFLLLLFRNRSPRFLLTSTVIFLAIPVFLQLPLDLSTNLRQGIVDLASAIRIDDYPTTLYQNGSYLEITRLRIQGTVNGLVYSLFSLGNVFGMFTLGLAAGKSRFFRQLDSNLPLIRKWSLPTLIVAVVFNGLFLSTVMWQDRFPAAYWQTIRVGSRTIGAPAMMLFYIATFIRLSLKERWRDRIQKLAPIGKTALSNYLLQSIMATLIFYGYGLGFYGSINPTIGLALTILIYLLQIRISGWWMDRFVFGPAEWLWRTLTYGQVQRIRRTWPFEPEDRQRRPLLSRSASRSAVVGVLLILLVTWFIGLILWDQSLRRERIQPAQFYASLPQRNILVVEGETSEEPSTLVEAVSTPAVQPVPYRPNEVAASGDLVAMASMVDVDQAFQQIETLSSPAFSGRLAGSTGGWRAAEYIAAQFAALGLQPAGENGGYFQLVDVPYEPLSSLPSLVIKDPTGNAVSFTLHDDFNVRSRGYSGPGLVEGPVVWANSCEPHDFDQINVVGSIVFCRDSSDVQADRNAIEHGAAGLLLLIDPATRYLDFAYPRFESLVPIPLPTLYVAPDVADAILVRSGYSRQDLTLLYESIPLQTTALLEVEQAGQEGCRARNCQGRNVLGVLPGRNNTVGSEIIILSAHYDHMGDAPDGTFWAGANDDASGVAALLEIARAWQSMGYVPQRTVLFAAWDGEELGLLGSRKFIEEPSYPLGDIRAVLQLDMIGAGGELLRVDGWGGLEPQILAAANLIGLDTIVSEMGRSDHFPFLQAGIPASMLGWADPDENYLDYHRPIDTPENIDRERFEQSLILSNLVILSLTEGEPSIEGLVTRRAQALLEKNLDAYLATSVMEIQSQDQIWFEDALSLNPVEFELEVEDILIRGDQATGEVSLRMVYESDETQIITGDVPVGFVNSILGWQWAGIDLKPFDRRASFEGDAFTSALQYALFMPDEAQDQISGILMEAEAYLLDTSRKLGLPLPSIVRIELHNNRTELRLSIPPSESQATSSWISDGTVKLVYREVIEDPTLLQDAFIRMMILSAGVSREDLPWLWEGLPLALRAEESPQEFQRRYIPQIFHIREGTVRLSDETAAWASVAYLQQQRGWRGVGSVIRSFGRVCRQNDCSSPEVLENAYISSLGSPSLDYSDTWQTFWFNKIDALSQVMDPLLLERVESISVGDMERFLSTVDGSIPTLLTEQEQYFRRAIQCENCELSYAWEPIVFFANGNILANITVETTFLAGDGTPERVRTSSTILFTQSGSSLLWAGGYYQELDNRTYRILFPEELETTVEEIAASVDEIYQFIRDHLPLPSFPRLTIKIFNREAEFQASISPLAFESQTPPFWSAPQESLKILASSLRTSDSMKVILAESLIRHILLQSGVESEWLLRGLSLTLFPELDQGTRSRWATRQLLRLPSQVSNDSLPSLLELPALDEADDETQALADAQAWDSVRYLTARYGLNSLIDFISTSGADPDSDPFIEVFGIDQQTFDDNWRTSIMQAHVPQEAFSITQGFDSEQAFSHIQYLADDDLEGRAPGSAGAHSAAEYISQAFSSYGLLPVVPIVVENGVEDEKDEQDETVVTELSTESSLDQTEYAYLQEFPVTITEFERQPALEIHTMDGGRLAQFLFREDFLTIPQAYSYDGPIAGELVWIRDDEFSGLNLQGKIILKDLDLDLPAEIEQALASNAAGLILITDSRGGEDFLDKQIFPLSEPAYLPMPVFQLSTDAFENLLEVAGESRISLRRAPPVLPLDLMASIDLPLQQPTESMDANVIGLLPGSDPNRSKEIIILGAHYDHVGDDPDLWQCQPNTSPSETSLEAGTCELSPGLQYPGTNDNASGVAVLLEIARVWHEQDYQPATSVLFVAWGAQEAGEIGSRYFLDHPVINLDQILAMIQLDSIAAGKGYYLEAIGTVDQDGLLLSRVAVLEDIAEARLSRIMQNSQEVLARTRSLREWLQIPSTDHIYQSDQLPFMERGVPSLVFRWRDANEENMPARYEEPIDIDRIGAVGRTIILLLMSLGG